MDCDRTHLLASLPQLLNLPQEIKDQIWEYAFGHAHILLYTSVVDFQHPDERRFTYNGPPLCEACERCIPRSYHLDTSTTTNVMKESSLGVPRPKRIFQPFYRCDKEDIETEGLLTCKSIFSEAVKIFLSTSTLHIRSPEAIALAKRSAPSSLRQAVNKIVVYIHFDNANHFLWCMRLLELHDVFPNLKHLAVSYHMRPPISYDNLLDAIYLSIPILGLPPPFNRPEYVLTEANRSPSCSSGPLPSSLPSTDPTPGTTIHTSYIHNETLFEAHFLGTITTADAHDEHTSVLRSIFLDPSYLTAAQLVLQSNSHGIQSSITSAYPPYAYPSELLSRGFANATYLPGMQHALLQIARRHERPWFEKLQKRRIVEVYVEHLNMDRNGAESLLERQLARMPDGEGIEELMERLLMQGDEEMGEGLVEAFGVALGLAQEQEEGEQDSAELQ